MLVVEPSPTILVVIPQTLSTATILDYDSVRSSDIKGPRTSDPAI